MRHVRIILLSLILCTGLITNAQSRDSADVIKAAEIFVKAFTGFDWPVFRNCFSKEATIFFPAWKEGERKTGQQEIEATWTAIFPEFIDSTKKFDLKINPKNIHVQLYGEVAIVTFHLGDGVEYLSRRTLVFRKEKTNWKIVHLHASTLRKENNL